MFKWFKKQKGISQRLAGLEEKKQSTQRKIEVAMKILDRRQEERRMHIVEVEEDRRGKLNSDILHGTT